MKTHYYLAAVISLPLLLSRCAEAPNWNEAKDSTPPQAVLNPSVKDINGGAVITYTLPPDTDLKGVKAIYSYHDGGEMLEAYASAYTDSIKLVGFPDTKERKVQLIAYDKSRNESQPVEVVIRPLIPPVEVIRNTLYAGATFDGVLVKWDNPTRADIGVTLFAEDSTGFMALNYTYFTRESGYYAFRGFKDQERKFRVVVRDRWNNTATPLDTVLTPLFEEDVVAKDELNRVTWIRYGYTDSTTLWRGDYRSQMGVNMGLDKMFDGIKTDKGYFHPGIHGNAVHGWTLNWYTRRSADKTIQPKPQYVTIDMTRKTTLSRCKIYHRNGGTVVNQNDPYHIAIWATDKTPKQPEDFPDRLTSLAYWTNWAEVNGTDAWKKDWTMIGDLIFVPPSGRHPLQWNTTTNREDWEWAMAGAEFDFLVEHQSTPFRYLRIECIANLKFDAVMQFHEVEFYGSAR